MATYRERYDPVRLLWRRLLFLVILVLIVLAAWAVWGVYRKERESAALRAQADGQLVDLTERKMRLTTNIGILETDRGKEEALRSQYQVGKPGEGLIIIVDETPSSTATTTPPTWYQKAFSWW